MDLGNFASKDTLSESRIGFQISHLTDRRRKCNAGARLMDRKTIALKNEIRVAIESLVTRCNIKSHQGSRAKYRRIQAAPIMPQAPTRPTVGTRTRCQHVSAWQVDVNGWVGGDGENARGERMARRRTTRATERERERERERAYNRPDHDG